MAVRESAMRVAFATEIVVGVGAATILGRIGGMLIGMIDGPGEMCGGVPGTADFGNCRRSDA